MSCKLEVFPRTSSAIYLAKLLFFSTVIAIGAACFSVGLNGGIVEDPTFDPTLQVLSNAGNFIEEAIYGMIIFILPFGLGGLGAGYAIEHDSGMKSRTAAIGFVSGALLGYSILFGVVINSPTFIAAASGALTGFAVGIIASSIRFGRRTA